MNPSPAYLTREEMESRRLAAAPELHTLRTKDLCDKYGVSRQTVIRWRHAVDSGAGLKRRITPGRPALLTPEQFAQLPGLYRDHWTSAEFGCAIEKRFGVKYDDDHVCRLMKRFGLRRRRAA